MQPLVSVIVITRNRPDMVRDCLDHLQAQTYRNFEALIVDSSTDGETAAVAAAYADFARNISTGLPLGTMPAARNIGLAEAKGELLAFLDDDAMAAPGWLEEVVRGFDDDRIGAVGGRVIDAGEQRMKAAYERAGLAAVVGRVDPDGTLVDNFMADVDRPIFVDRLRGCNMTFSRAAVEAVGPFDENITGTNAFDDTDYCLRVGRAGFRLRFCPAAEVHHLAAPKEGFERTLADPRYQYYFARNYAYVLLKNRGFSTALLKNVVLSRNAVVVRALAATIYKAARGFGAAVAGTTAGLLAATAPERARPAGRTTGRAA